MSPTAIEYFYDEAGVNFGGTSGAPLLNESGEVVGLNLGGGALRGKEFGFGNPATSFAALVSAAVESNQRHATDRDALGKTMAAILKGFAEGDVDTVMLYHHPDVAKALSYTKTLTGRDAVKADLAGTFQSFRLEFVEHHLESLLVQDDYAVEQTTFAIKGTPKAGGESWIFRGRALVVYVRYVGSPTGWASLREMIQPATE